MAGKMIRRRLILQPGAVVLESLKLGELMIPVKSQRDLICLILVPP